MDNITLGQVKDVVLFLVALIGGISSLYVLLMKGFDERLQPIKDDIRDEKKERLKSDLTTFMFLAEHGELSNDQKLRAHEEYDMYIKMGGNSWVHDRFEILKKEGKI
jgi:hypothetical protein